MFRWLTDLGLDELKCGPGCLMCLISLHPVRQGHLNWLKSVCQISAFPSQWLKYIHAPFARSRIPDEPPFCHLSWLTGDLGHNRSSMFCSPVSLTEETSEECQITVQNNTKAISIPKSSNTCEKQTLRVIVCTNPFTAATNGCRANLLWCDSQGLLSFFSFLLLVPLIFPLSCLVSYVC